MQDVLRALDQLQQPNPGNRSEPDSAQGLEAPPPPLPATEAENRISIELEGLAATTPVARLEAPEQSTASPGSFQATTQGGSEPQGSVAPVGASGTEKTILFVEDDPFVLKLYKKRLSREGFRVEIADDGAVALEKLPQIKPNLVVLDLMLPKVQGIEVIKFIRADRELERTPVLVLSNAFLDDMAAKAMEAGASKGILKTACPPAKLVELVRELLGRTPAGAMVSEQVSTADPDAGAAGDTTAWLKANHPVRTAPVEIPKIRRICLDYIKAAGTEESFAHLETLYRSVRRLSARAGLSGLTKICEVASALEALLFELVFRFSQATPSALQSVIQAVDCLDRLFQRGDSKFPEPRLKARVLVVDDDAVCMTTSVAILKRAHFDPVGVQDPKESLRILQTGCFDLIILAIDMPQLDGFQVCEKLRQMPQHKSCPVMFVTRTSGFRDRARSVLAGGNDFLTKPVSPMELVLKAVLHVVNFAPRPAATPHQALPGGQETRSLPSAARSKLQQTKPAGESEPLLAVNENRLEAPAESPTESHRVADQRLNATAAPCLTPSRPPEPIPEMSATATVTGASPAEEPGGTPQPKNGASAEGGASAEQSVRGKESNRPTAPGASDAASGMPEQKQKPSDEVERLRQESARQREALAVHAKERQTFIDRIYIAESDLSCEQSRVKRQDKAIESLQKELEAWRSNGAKLEAVAPDSNELGAAAAPAILAEQAQQRAQSRCEELEKELAKLRQELSSKCSDHEKAALDSATRARELEQRLAQQTGALERAQADVEWQLNEQIRVEAELRKQFDTAMAGHKQAQERCTRLEQELGGLRQAGEELNARLTKEQQASAESAKRIRDLEDRLGQKAAELQQATSTLETHAKDRTHVEAELRIQFDTAMAGHKQAQERCTRLEQELGGLRQAGEELNARLTKEQQASAESAKRIRDLEDRLGQKAAELQQATATLETHAKDRTHVEAELRKQFDSATVGHKQAKERCTQLEQELGGLRQTGEELNEKLTKEQQASAESAKRIRDLEDRLGQKAAELQQATATLETHAKDRTHVEAELRKQLDTATVGHKQAQEHCTRLEQELGGLRQAREELNAKLTKEQQASAESAKQVRDLEASLGQKAAELQKATARLETLAEDRTHVEAELRKQFDSATAGHKQAKERCTQLEQELGGLRQTGKELNEKLTKEQQASAESAKQVRDLEASLGPKAAELQKATARLETLAKDRTHVEAELRKQLDTATAGHKQAKERCTQLEQELGGLRQTGKELNEKLTKEQQASAKSAKRVRDLEDRLGQKAAELQKATTTLETLAKDRTHVEVELRKQFDTATAGHKQAQERCTQLEQELGGLRQAGEELTLKLTKEQQASAESAKQVRDLEARLGQKAAELQKATGKLKRVTIEQEKTIAELKKQLEEAVAAHAQVQTQSGQLQQELGVLRQTHEQLAARLEDKEHKKAESARLINELEALVSKLQTTSQS